MFQKSNRLCYGIIILHYDAIMLFNRNKASKPVLSENTGIFFVKL